MAEESTGKSTITARESLVKQIAESTNLSRKQVSAALEAMLSAIREALQNGQEVRLVGFGTFKVRTSAARKGVNPRDRQPIEVPAKERVRFSAGKELSEAVRKK